MSVLGRLEITITDSTGAPVSGASVEVRRQGAQANGSGTGTSITVDAVNGVVAADTVRLNTETSPTRTVSSITATNVTVGAPGFTSWSDDDRITIVSALPTVYEDASSATTKSNPLTTDANGYAWCYATPGMYDCLLSGGGLTTTLKQDVPCVSPDQLVSNAYSGTAVTVNTLRALAVGDKLLDVQTAGSSKFSVAGDGEIVAGASGATHALTGNTTVTGNVTATGTLTAQTSGSSITGTLTIAGTSGNIQQAGTLVANALAAATGFTGNVTVSGSGKSLTVSGTGGFRNSGGGTRLDGGQLSHGPYLTFADQDTTPDVSLGNFFTAANSVATTITRFDGLTDGEMKVIWIKHTNANTTYARTAGTLRTSAATVNPTQYDIICFVQVDDVSPNAMNQAFTVVDVS